MCQVNINTSTCIDYPVLGYNYSVLPGVNIIYNLCFLISSCPFVCTKKTNPGIMNLKKLYIYKIKADHVTVAKYQPVQNTKFKYNEF